MQTGNPNSSDEIIPTGGTSQDDEAELEKLENLRLQFSTNGEYDKAKLCTIKAKELKINIKTKKKKDLVDQQLAEVENLEQQYQQEIEKLNSVWDQKFQSLQEKSQKAEIAINERQQKEMEDLYAAFEQKFSPKIKFSKEFLNLENQEKMLVKFQKFDEAKIIRKKKEIQKQKDIDKWNKEKTEKIKTQVIQKSNKHVSEKNILKKKFEVELDLLRAEKQKQIQHLEKKFQNKKLELELQQKNERNLAENELINKKRQFGLSYMVSNDPHHYRINTNSNMNTKNGNQNKFEEEKEFQEEDLQKFYNGQESEADLKDTKNEFNINEAEKMIAEVTLHEDKPVAEVNLDNGNNKGENKEEKEK